MVNFDVVQKYRCNGRAHVEIISTNDLVTALSQAQSFMNKNKAFVYIVDCVYIVKTVDNNQTIIPHKNIKKLISKINSIDIDIESSCIES